MPSIAHEIVQAVATGDEELFAQRLSLVINQHSFLAHCALDHNTPAHHRILEKLVPHLSSRRISECLLRAIETDNLGAFAVLLPSYVSTQHNSEALRHAVQHVRPQMVADLLPVSDCSVYNFSAVCEAAAEGHWGIVELLLGVCLADLPPPVTREILEYAAIDGQAQLVQTFLPTAPTPLDPLIMVKTAQQGHWEVVADLYPHSDLRHFNTLLESLRAHQELSEADFLALKYHQENRTQKLLRKEIANSGVPTAQRKM